MRKVDRQAVSFLLTHDEPIPVRDGTVLRADVYRPAEGGPVPTVLARNPYGPGMSRMVPVRAALDAGFAVVIQNCRGRGTSDGDFEPWRDEPADGADTVDWVAAQPWSDGNVTGWGVSYLAGTALQTAIERPAGYKALIAIQTPADFYDSLNYYGGAFALGSAQGWATLQGLLGGQHAMLAGEDAGPLLGAALPAMLDPTAARASLPLEPSLGLPAAMPAWADWLRHPTRDEYWQSFASPRDNYERIALPTYHVAGWFDLFLAGTLENYQGLREGSVLVIGPWGHAGFMQTGIGEVDFGAMSTAQPLMLDDDQFRFLREVCQDGTPAGQRPPVRIFVMGDNVWREEQEWPLARAVSTSWYLQADGGLAPSPSSGAASSGESRYSSDPRDPVPTVGGNLLFPEYNAAGPHDQRALDGRTDILRFTSTPLAADLEVTGALSVVLHAATDCVDTDWTAKLVDVHPDGAALNVADGILRARYRNGFEAAELLTPGQPYEYVIDLAATSQVFKAGHALRVDIASTNFPRFDRNPGNGVVPAEATEDDLTVQHQTVFHDAARPSRIVLPVIPR